MSFSTSCPKPKTVIAVTNADDEPLALEEIQEEVALQHPEKKNKDVEVCLLDVSYTKGY